MASRSKPLDQSPSTTFDNTPDLAKNEPLWTSKHDGPVYGAIYSRDESRVLTWSEDSTAKLWDPARKEPLQTFKHSSSVNGAVLSRDESRVLTWSDHSTAKLWDAIRNGLQQTFKHDGPVLGAGFSRDESRLLTWSGDKTAKLWDPARNEPLQTFKHDGDVWNAVFSRDESHVLTSGLSAARLWRIPSPADDLAPDERILELEIRSASRLDSSGLLRPLLFSEWMEKAQEWDRVRGNVQAVKQNPAQPPSR